MARVPGDLYIKYASSGDDGSQVIPAGAAFWASPSVWLTDTDGNTIPQAVVGQDNVVNVQVDSMSTDPRTNVKVQAWVCDYTPGFIGPDSARASSGGQNGRTGTVGGTVTMAGPGTAHVVWHPDPTDLINGPNANTGHLCVGANVYVENLPVPEGARLSSGQLDVINNRHHGWKNITVVAAPPGILPMGFRLTNPGTEEDEFQLIATELDRELAMGPLELEHLLAAGFVDLVDGAPEPRPVPAACLREPRERTRLAKGGTLVLRGMPEQTRLCPADEPARVELRTDRRCGEGPEATIGGKPGENVPVLFTMEAGGKPGEVHTFDIVQRTRDGQAVGGARLIAVNVPEWHCCV